MSRYNLGCLGQCIGKYYRKGHQRITGFDYSEAADVKLWLGTEGYDLKSTNQKMLHRDPGVQGDEAERKELSTHLKELHKDETSASIVEKGYYYSVDKSRTADIFEFDLKAITGDTQNSKMVFDVVVEDEVLTGMYDTVHLCIACVAEDLSPVQRFLVSLILYSPNHHSRKFCSLFTRQNDCDSKLSLRFACLR